MVKISKNILFTLLLTTISSIVAVDTVGNSYFLGHTGDISGNGLLHEAGRAHKTNKDIYYCGNLHVEYNQNFDKESLGNYLFFSGTNSMVVGPRNAGTTGHSDTDFYNLNMLLPSEFKATVTALPKVQTATINLSGSAHLNHLMKGLHLSLNLPLVYTKHDMQFIEVSSAAGANIPAGAIKNGAAITPANTTFIQAMQGASLDGDVNTAMKYGKVNGEQHHFRPGNATIAVGYDAIQKEDYHLGFSVIGLINGGKRSNAEHWFEEGIGTAGRHGAGARLDAHKKLYQKDKNTVTGYLKADLIHAFGANVWRTYDYQLNGAGSRYILVKEFTGVTTTAGTYNNIMHYGTNISTLQAKIGIPLLYNLNAMLRWEHGKTSINVGYQLWGHNQEKHYGWKTTIDTSKYGFVATTAADPSLVGILTAASTAGNGSGTRNDGNSLDVQVSGLTVGTISAQVTSTRTIKTDDLNKASALAPSARSHKFFANLSRCCAEHENMPFVGIGASAELSGKDNNTTDQWGVFVNGGFCF